MPYLVDVLKDLPKAGLRLRGGLALRISKGNGMVVLGCSRVDVPPSETEMEEVVKAVKAAFGPDWIWRALEVEERGQHRIWRLYWPQEPLTLIYSVESEVTARPLLPMVQGNDGRLLH